MATIGLKDIYYCLLLTDPVPTTAVPNPEPTYAASTRVVGAISASINPNSSTETLFYDDGPGDSATTMGEIELELNLADIPLETQAVWLGSTYDNGMLIKKSTDTPPYLALGFRTLKSNGSYRYYWLAKGKFGFPEEEYNTKGDSVEFGTPTINGAFVKRDCDDEWERTADEDDEGVPEDLIANWFTSPVYKETP